MPRGGVRAVSDESQGSSSVLQQRMSYRSKRRIIVVHCCVGGVSFPNKRNRGYSVSAIFNFQTGFRVCPSRKNQTFAGLDSVLLAVLAP